MKLISGMELFECEEDFEMIMDSVYLAGELRSGENMKIMVTIEWDLDYEMRQILMEKDLSEWGGIQRILIVKSLGLWN